MDLLAWLAALAFLAAAAWLIGCWRPRLAAPAAALAAALAGLLLAGAWAAGAGPVDLPLLSVAGSRLRLALDPLGAPLAIFACLLAAPILYWAGAYLSHLPSAREVPGAVGRFHGLMLAFMLAMVLLLLARDLLLIFLALELTAGVSYLLIRFDREDPAARGAAATALLVTAGSSLAFLLGALLLAHEAGTLALPELSRLPEVSVPAAALLAAGVLGKSAQVPLHFWLPRAMKAPTPVSAYLHSAALVAAGVFVLQRIRPLLESAPPVLEALIWVGFASVGAGALMALVSDELKRILAYSTMAQYGYVVVMVSVGGHEALAGAALFILAHGVCKCALFMTAGTVTIATGEEGLSAVGGLWRRMPVLAAASAIAAAGLAGLPLTVGYFKDELFLKGALHHGTVTGAAAAAAVALTVAYAARFWCGIFLGRSDRPAERPQPTLVAPVVLLALFVVLGGLWAGPLEQAFAAAAAVTGAPPQALELAYKPSLSAGVAVLAWLAGLLLLAAAPAGRGLLRDGVRSLTASFGPARLADLLVTGLERLSWKLHGLELRDLRDRFGAVLVPTAILLAGSVFAQGELFARVGGIRWGDLPLAAALTTTAVAVVSAVRTRSNVSLVISLSVAGFALALTLLLAGAPDVALVVVLVETLLTLLFLGTLNRLHAVQPERAPARASDEHRGRWAGWLAGATVFFPAWFALAAGHDTRVGNAYLEWTQTAHARDAVTAILADFRGLDTAVELTVFAVALLGAAAVTWRRAE